MEVKKSQTPPVKRPRTTLDCTGSPSPTKQSFKAGTAVDAILKKYATQGVNPNDVGLFSANVAHHGQFGVQPTLDYHDMLEKVIRAENWFKSLPSALRERFGHDVGQVLAFMANPQNTAECVKLKLFREDPKPDPVNTQTSNPHPSTSTSKTPEKPAEPAKSGENK